jgi:hypothetical protein
MKGVEIGTGARIRQRDCHQQRKETSKTVMKIARQSLIIAI